MDNTLPCVPKKRKLNEVEETADNTPKKMKTESVDGKSSLYYVIVNLSFAIENSG